MIQDDLVDLYHLYEEEEQLKEQLARLRGEILDVKDSMTEIKERLTSDLAASNSKLAKYKNMTVTLTSKTKKTKVSKSDLAGLIEEIIALDVSGEDKKDRIMRLLTPQPSGTFVNSVTVKLTKKTKS